MSTVYQHQHRCVSCNALWPCIVDHYDTPYANHCDVCSAAREAAAAMDANHSDHTAAVARDEHAALRLQFALALATDFAGIAAIVGRTVSLSGRAVDMAVDSPVLRLFDLADALAIEHERRCAEDAKGGGQ